MSSPISGSAVELDVASGNNAYLDSSVGVIAVAPPAGASLVITVWALTSGSLNLADVELNAYSTTNGTGTAIAGYALSLLGQPGTFAYFRTTQAIPTTARSIRARLRARGTGSLTLDNLTVSVQT